MDETATRTALITGGSGGIGTALCAELLAQDYRVVVADLVPPSASDVDFVHTDVTDQDSLDHAVAHAVSTTGRLDHVFLNAGVTSEDLTFDRRLDLAAYRKAVSINLDGVVLGVNAALPALSGTDGAAIVATASLAGVMAIPTDPIYSATKHAVVGLVRSLGAALAPVTINAVCPTFTDTPILDGIRAGLETSSVALLKPTTVATALVEAAQSEASGQCFYVQVGRPIGIFEFRRPPGPRP